MATVGVKGLTVYQKLHYIYRTVFAARFADSDRVREACVVNCYKYAEVRTDCLTYDDDSSMPLCELLGGGRVIPFTWVLKRHFESQIPLYEHCYTTCCQHVRVVEFGTESLVKMPTIRYKLGG